MQRPSCVEENVSGATLTTMQVGGVIRFFARVKTVDQLREVQTWGRAKNLETRVIGAGSNLIFPDAGVTGLVIRMENTEAAVLPAEEAQGYEDAFAAWKSASHPEVRHTQGKAEGVLQLPSDDDEAGEPQLVSFGAGMLWGQAVMWSLQQSLIGLEWFSRIPCRVGGAVFNNIHGGTHFFSEYIVAVHAIDEKGEEQVFSHDDLKFAYDYSLFHEKRGLSITKVICALDHVSPELAAKKRDFYLHWTQEKTRVQPAGPNCGSVFQNLGAVSPELTPLAISEKIQRPEEGWSQSAARYIDLAGCKGMRVGGMEVFPGHANFICNVGIAEGRPGTAEDLATLIKLVMQRVNERFSLTLVPEVEFLQ